MGDGGGGLGECAALVQVIKEGRSASCLRGTENDGTWDTAEETVELVTDEERSRCEEAWVGVSASGSGSEEAKCR